MTYAYIYFIDTAAVVYIVLVVHQSERGGMDSRAAVIAFPVWNSTATTKHNEWLYNISNLSVCVCVRVCVVCVCVKCIV